MITKAKVEQISPDGYHVKVRIPTLHKIEGAPGATPFEELPYALVCYAPGCKPNLTVGDIVYVGFENNQISEPVILGMLLNNTFTNSSTTINADSLNVNIDAQLPYNQTNVGNINVSDLANNISLSTLNGLNNKIELLENHINNCSIVVSGTDNGWYYYKYNDGTYDAYKRLTLTNEPCTTDWQSLYVTAAQDFGSRPSFDNQGLQIIVTFVPTGNSSGWAMAWGSINGASRPTGTWVVVRPSTSSAVTGHLAAHIHSTWK